MNYRKSLEQAVIYIENHLGYNIMVEDVAKAAGYSYYHLNRQFTAILGESIGSYIKKRRLADASKKLLYTDLKIIDIAIEYGFDSPEAFSRAFKAIYKSVLRAIVKTVWTSSSAVRNVWIQDCWIIWPVM